MLRRVAKRSDRRTDRMRCATAAAWTALVLCAAPVRLAAQEAAEFVPKLRIAFSSYRERPKHPNIHVYDHDGVGQGKIVAVIPVTGLRADSRPSLRLDGRTCYFAAEVENSPSRILAWDLVDKKQHDLPILNDSPNAVLHPSASGDGRWIAFAAWGRPGSTSRWDVLVHDTVAARTDPVPQITTGPHDERMPALSADGQFLAYVSNGPGTAGASDVFLCRWRSGTVDRLAAMNSPGSDVQPALSGDGRLLAFASDRPGGAGGRDILLFDREKNEFVPLPGLNTAAHEQTPHLSSDGRWLAFVSERLRGEGERDVFLYDRTTGRLVPTPGLNGRGEDLDPCVIVLPDPNAGR